MLIVQIPRPHCATPVTKNGYAAGCCCWRRPLDESVIPLTHDILSVILGVRRAGRSAALSYPSENHRNHTLPVNLRITFGLCFTAKMRLTNKAQRFQRATQIDIRMMALKRFLLRAVACLCNTGHEPVSGSLSRGLAKNHLATRQTDRRISL